MRLSVLAATLFLALPAWAQDDLRTISVTGEGSVEVQPDMVVISMGARADAKTASEALRQSSSAVSATLEVLKAAGVAERDIQTSNVSLSPRWQHSSTGNTPPKIAGYTASNTLTVRVRDLGSLGDVLDAVVSEGANSLGGISFTLSDPSETQNSARRAAVADARSKAELYAEAAGVELGDVASISEQSMGAPRPQMMRAEMAMSDAAGVPVAPGEVTTTTRIHVVYTIAD